MRRSPVTKVDYFQNNRVLLCGEGVLIVRTRSHTQRSGGAVLVLALAVDEAAKWNCRFDIRRWMRRVPPGNKLEALKGNRAGLHSIRVNEQFRICFRWTREGPEDVEIIDYH